MAIEEIGFRGTSITVSVALPVEFSRVFQRLKHHVERMSLLPGSAMVVLETRDTDGEDKHGREIEQVIGADAEGDKEEGEKRQQDPASLVASRIQFLFKGQHGAGPSAAFGASARGRVPSSQ